MRVGDVVENPPRPMAVNTAEQKVAFERRTIARFLHDTRCDSLHLYPGCCVSPGSITGDINLEFPDVRGTGIENSIKIQFFNPIVIDEGQPVKTHSRQGFTYNAAYAAEFDYADVKPRQLRLAI